MGEERDGLWKVRSYLVTRVEEEKYAIGDHCRPKSGEQHPCLDRGLKVLRPWSMGTLVVQKDI